MRISRLVLIVVVAALSGGMAGGIVIFYLMSGRSVAYQPISERQQVVLTGQGVDSSSRLPEGLNFMRAAHAVVDAVVHIKVSYGPGKFSLSPLDYFYDPPARPSGSGVIISDQGFIVTNHHVIENASNIEVILSNNQRYYANLVGDDPTTDLALLRIKAVGLPFVRYGNSDLVYPGEWVLAVGNPFNLNSTVTAGIVSARARNIGVLRDRNNLQVESFLQTDAAVNPGNSGGALVNLDGELVGINTAIATSTGNYAGYAFAIPVNLVKKVMDDLQEYGQVQRGLLGVQIVDMNADLAEHVGQSVNQGAFVNHVNPGSAAEQSGIKRGDIIVGIDGHPVVSVSELQERIAIDRPGTKVEVRFYREGQQRKVDAVLKRFDGEMKLEARAVLSEFDGMTVADVPPDVLKAAGLTNGVEVTKLGAGAFREAGIREHFLLGFVDKIPVDDVATLNQILAFKNGGILLEGYYPDGKKGTYGVDWKPGIRLDYE